MNFNKIEFKTNLHCEDCIVTMTPLLNAVVGEGNWSVDLEHPSKMLTLSVADPGNTLRVQAAFEKAGYTAEPLF